MLGALVPSVWCGKITAATINLQPVADTTLCEYAPDNNLGGTDFFIAGSTGGTAGGTKNRALIRFDLSAIPANSKIKSVSLLLEVAHFPPVDETPSFALHRMLRSWGEGDKDSSEELTSRGLGYPATVNEATWLSPFAFTTNTWSGPGGIGDFASIVSSRALVNAVLFFPLFDSTPELIADVQTWLDNPAANFGWMLKAEDEDLFFSSRAYGSREFTGIDTNSAPIVMIEFMPPPVISGTQFQDGQFTFSFLAEADQNYFVEFKSALSPTNAWQSLTNISAQISSTNILISDPLSADAKFYRVVAP